MKIQKNSKSCSDDRWNCYWNDLLILSRLLSTAVEINEYDLLLARIITFMLEKDNSLLTLFSQVHHLITLRETRSFSSPQKRRRFSACAMKNEGEEGHGHQATEELLMSETFALNMNKKSWKILPLRRCCCALSLVYQIKILHPFSAKIKILKKKNTCGPKLEGYAFGNFGYSSGTEEKSRAKKKQFKKIHCQFHIFKNRPRRPWRSTILWSLRKFAFQLNHWKISSFCTFYSPKA